MTRRRKAMQTMFETRSHAWEDVGLARQLTGRAARKAQRQVVLFVPIIVGILVFYDHQRQILGPGFTAPARIFTVVALTIVGWAFARDLGRAAGPALFRRLDPGTAGTVGFLIRLVGIVIVALAALRIAGLKPQTLAVGGAFTGVIIGLAAQQTLGNLFAGTVLLSARPFRVGERVRLQGGGVAGRIEGIVSSLGLLYTTLASGEDRIMVPNSVLLSLAITPMSEPAAVDLRARLPADVRPSDLQTLLTDEVKTETRGAPDIQLEELDGDEVVVRIMATPARKADGHQLADEVMAVVTSLPRMTPDGTPPSERRDRAA